MFNPLDRRSIPKIARNGALCVIKRAQTRYQTYVAEIFLADGQSLK
jgi:hypothetical protein